MTTTAAIPFDVVAEWSTVFEGEIAYQVERTETDPATWGAGGRASKAWPDKENRAWWDQNGPEMAQGYIDWRDSTPLVVWTTPAGEPAVELDLRVTFGGVPVRVIIDRVFVTPTGELIVVDLKTGSQMPNDQGLQLGFYASALEVMFGIRPSWCAYYNARKGNLTEPYHPDQWTPDYIGQLLNEFIRARELGVFLPHPSRNCGNCGVRRACPAVKGPEAHLYMEDK